ncbi:S8 family serine peptidase [candidate division WOR-3 bacterium]|nr:S8 family serine peptidase [candidate division WOR-3 bacterium]
MRRTLLFLALTAVAASSAAKGSERHVPGQALVKFAPAMRAAMGDSGCGVPGFDLPGLQGARYHRILPRPDSLAQARGLDLQYLLAFDTTADAAALVRNLEGSPLVEYACPNALLMLDSFPDDSLYPEQWHLDHIGAPGAWAIAHGDDSVYLAVVADGVHWTHPDLEANLRVNSAEDINHNGRFDSLPAAQGGDVDGIDQDGNGYPDDVIGYDFLNLDPNPMATDSQSSGTHGAGVQNAVTDNQDGVSAPPWNVRSIVVRCGSQGYVNLVAAIAAIYCLVSEGACSFGMPFGSTAHYPPLADACLYAWDSGAIPCASAGHDGGEVVRYPAAYEGVIAVAAHGRDNRKSPFSNYGIGIDVTAPGEDILSTAGPGGYAAWDGTSVACNVVVGILGWLKSAYPDASRDSLVSLLKNMCDTMPDPLYRQGKLGSGRVRMSVPQAGIEEGHHTPYAGSNTPGPSVVRGMLRTAFGRQHPACRAELLDISGRKVMELQPGENDIRHLSPGIYFVRSEPSAVSRQPSAVRKVVVTR